MQINKKYTYLRSLLSVTTFVATIEITYHEDSHFWETIFRIIQKQL